MTVQVGAKPLMAAHAYGGAPAASKTVNLWYAARLGATVATVVIALYVVHRWQAGRQAGAFVHQADVAEQQGDLGRAANYLRRYLVMRPGDVDARARLAMLMEETAVNAEEHFRAFLEMEEVLRQAPGRDDVRRRNISIAMDPRLAMYEEALGHLKHLRTQDDNDGTLCDLEGQCRAAQGNFAAAADAYDEAVKRKPDLLLAYVRRAGLLRVHLDIAKKADDTVAAMLSANKDSARAHVLAAGYYHSLGNAEQAAAQTVEAVRCGPNDPEVILLVADLARSRAAALKRGGKAAEARRAIEEACGPLRHAVDQGLAAAPATAPRSGRTEWDQARQVLARLVIALSEFEVLLDRPAEALSVARRGVESLPERPEVRRYLVDLSISRREWDEANHQLDLLESAGVSPETVLYGRGRLAVAQERWPEAARVLERTAEMAARFPELVAKANFLLADCYDHQGLLDRRYEAYRRALPANPGDELWPVVSQRLAECLTEMGRADEAIRTYEQMAVRYPAALVPAARLRLIESLRQPEARRQWSAVEDALARAPESMHRELVRADLLLAQNRADEARAALARAMEKYPESPEPWGALALLDWRQKRPGQAAETLRRAEAKFGDVVLYRILRARMVPDADPTEMLRALECLATGIDKFSAAERRRLLGVLAETAQAYAGREAANPFWDRLADEAPHNLNVQLVRFDNAMQAGDEARLLNAKAAVIRVDEGGSSARMAQALYLIWKAQKQGDHQGLSEARDLLLGLERQRPGWSRVPLAEALILDLERKPDQAVLKYREAIDLGERNPEAVRRLIELYYEQRQYAEAEALLQRLPDEAQAKGTFAEVAAEISLQARDFSKALRLIARIAPADTKDYRKLMWRGRVLWMAGETKEAEKPFLQARDLDPARPDAWVALVLYYIDSGRKPEAAQAAAAAADRIKEPEAPLALGQCFEALGDLDTARRHYDAALKAQPDDLKVLKSVASFRLREGKFDDARTLLERVLKSDKHTKDDERLLRPLLTTTMMLAANRNYEQSRASLVSLDLLDKEGLPKPITGKETPDEVVSRALAFAILPELRRKRDAIHLLEEYGARKKLGLSHQFLLAQLYNAVGDWPRARALLTTLVNSERDNPDPLHLRYLAAGLIRQPDLAEAEARVAQLEKMQPEALSTIELRARLLAVAGEREKAQDYLIKAAEKPGNLAVAARLLEQIGAGAAAEPLYKKLVAADERPEAKLRLAAYYGRQHRVDEALTLCEPAWKSVRPELVTGVSVEALYAAREASPALIDRVTARVREAMTQRPSVALLSSLAALQNLRGDYKDAIGTYRQVIERDPDDVLAVNNRAFLLAASAGMHDEALAELERAKAKFGPIPLLLDTEAQVHIARKQPAKAIELLHDAIAQDPSGTNYFHLALASFALRNRIEAVTAWREAMKLGLKPADLHALERGEFRRLESEIGK